MSGKFLAAAIFLSILSNAAIAQKGQTSMGTDFWMGFMPNSFYVGCCPPENCILYISSPTPNEVHVDVYGGSDSSPVESYQMTLAANSTWTIPARAESAWEDLTCEKAVNYGIHVYSKNPIVAYGYQYTGENTSSSDSYLALPTPALGKEYYTSCYYDDHYSLEPSNPLAGQFLIVSPYDSNRVTIGPVKTDTRSDRYDSMTLHHRGDTWSVTLMKGQTYLVQSTGADFGSSDLTGTHIVSSKPIGLISGHQLCSIPIGELATQNGSKDEIMEMIPPLDEWGFEYFDMPTATRGICGDLVRVIAGDSDETITAMNGNGNPTEMLLRPGDFYDFDQITTPTVFSSVGGKKFLAVQMAYSQNYLGDTGKADPFSCILPAARQFQKLMMFQPPNRTGVGGFVHYATFICPEDSITHIQVNGKPISFYTSAGRSVFPGTNPLVGADRILLDPSLCYVAKGPVPFGCYLDGWSIYESYGHPASLSLGINSSDILPPLEWQTSTCGTFHVILQDLQPPQFKQFGSRIADIALITDAGDLRWPTPSSNFALSFDSPFTPGDSVAHLTLSVVDPSHNAYAALWTTDRAGNDTVYQYSYLAPSLEPPNDSSFDFGTVGAGAFLSKALLFENTSKQALTIDSERIVGLDASFFQILSSVPITISPGSRSTQLLYINATDTANVLDTLVLTIGCAEVRYPLHLSVVTGLINAGDLNFGTTTVGDTVCKSVSISNPGKAALILYPNALLMDTSNFSFPDWNALPDTLAPGAEINLELCFHPRTSDSLSSIIRWRTNLAGIFQHQIKDSSILTGVGVSSGVALAPSQPEISLAIQPNPVTGIAIISLAGAPEAIVQVYDVLGREVGSFRVTGSYEWNTGNLPAGTYIVRAETGGTVVSRRIVKE